MKTILSTLTLAMLATTAQAVTPQEAGVVGIMPWGNAAPPVAVPLGKIPAPGDKVPDIKIKPAAGSSGSSTVADVPRTEGAYSGPAAPGPVAGTAAPCVKKPTDLLPCDVAKTVGSGLKLFQSGMGIYTLYTQYKGSKAGANVDTTVPDVPTFSNATTPEELEAQAIARQQQAAAQQRETAASKAADFAENPANSANTGQSKTAADGRNGQITATAGTLPNARLLGSRRSASEGESLSGQTNPVVAAIAAQNAAEKAQNGQGGYALAAREGVFSRAPGAKPDFIIVDGQLVPIADFGRETPVLPAVARVKW